MPRRSGFTLMEMLTVLAITGVLLAVAYPRFGHATASMSVRSSKQEIAAYMAQARAAAIANGRAASFVRSGNIILVALDNGTTLSTYASAQDLNQAFGVTLSNPAGTTTDTVRFDPRGLTVTQNLVQITVTKAAKRDSVCVVGFGKITTTGCTL
jgi:prepilin-type N-terminal cleavage/methylation domain-containing protein